MTAQRDAGHLRRVLLKHARDAFVSDERIQDQWRALGYLAPPDYARACDEYERFAAVFEERGVSIDWMPAEDIGLDSIYVRDASIASDHGVIGGSMGKGARAAEPARQLAHLTEAGIPCASSIRFPGSVEGGDCAWLNESTLAVGRGYRTNARGIEQLRGLLPSVELLEVSLPHWKGPGDVFHLMSIVSPLADRIALVYRPLLSVPFVEWLQENDYTLVDVPDEEFESHGGNVLALSPDAVLALDGNPRTRRRIEAAGFEVVTYEGVEISQKGCGGPTCLTRPLSWVSEDPAAGS